MLAACPLPVSLNRNYKEADDRCECFLCLTFNRQPHSPSQGTHDSHGRLQQAVHNAGMGTEPNITADLTALQRLLAGLEGAIGAVKPGREGLTAPGRFLWQLLGRAGITLQSCPLMVMLMATAGELLTGTGQEGPALLGPLGCV